MNATNRMGLRVVRLSRVAAIFVALAFFVIAERPACAAATDFYSGKTITLVVGADVGGGYDAAGRLMAQTLGAFIPGHPTVVVENMPAGGSIAAANYLFNAAPRDGTVIGLLQRNVLTAKLSNPAVVKFDIGRFGWIGSLSRETGLLVVWRTASGMSTGDLFKHTTIVGGTIGTDTDLTARLLKTLTGAKLSIVDGYKGNADVLLAMQRGEVQGIADESWSNLKLTWPDYVKAGKVSLLLQNALEKSPDLPNVPLALDYVRDPIDRKVMQLYFGQKTIARPVVAPPGLPADRLELLKSAFIAMTASAPFQALAVRSKLQIDAAYGPAVDQAVAALATPPAEVAKRFTAVTKAAP
jgi:tripartite-type tricarboxylate transporter receptor subunit TctC